MAINPKNRFGINLSNLLIFHDINQSRLTKDLGINKSLVSRYLNGKTMPSETNLKKLASYFNIAPEALLNEDFSQLNGDTKNGIEFYRNLDVLLPLFQTEKCLENSHFRKAYEDHSSLIKRWSSLDFSVDDNVNKNIFSEYREAIKDNAITCETTANLLSMQFLSFISMRELALIVSDQDSMTLITRIELEKNTGLENRIRHNQDELDCTAQEYWELISKPEFQEEMLDYYCTLKNNAGWNNLADYYIGLQYYFGAVANPFSYVQNREIGMELLAVQACCDNPYADRFISLMISD